jgi:hypothetical protein
MNPMQIYENQVNPLFGKKAAQQPNPVKKTKYSNNNMKPFIGTPIEAYVTGVAYHPSFGCVVQYNARTPQGSMRVYDILDCPGVPKDLSDARKMRYMHLLGTHPKTIKSALVSGRSLSGSIGTIWGHRIKHSGKRLEAVLMPFMADSGYIYFGLLSAKVV